MRRVAWLLALLGGWCLAPAQAEEPFDEGIDYQLVEPAQPTETGDRVEVLELFWYGCPHCYNLEAPLARWRERQSAQVAFRRMPAILGESWAAHARAFYAAEVLGVQEGIHDALFHAIHEENRRLLDEDSLAAFFAEQGVDPEAFRKAFRSFAVEVKVRRAAKLTRRYGIDGVPAVVVEGRYRTSPTLTASRERMFAVLDYLVAREAARR